MTIVAGDTGSPTTVAAGGVAFDPIGGGTTSVSASATGVRAAVPVTVTVSSPGMTLLSVPALVGAGLMAGGGTARLGATAHGGVTVRITSSNPELLLVSRTPTTAAGAFVDVPVANGSTDASYWVHGVEEARGTVTLTATAPGFTQTQATTTVAETGLQLQNVPGSTTTLSPDSAFSVNIGVLNASGAIAQFQAVRTGAAPLSVTISHTNPAVAQLVSTSGAGQTRTVTIVAGDTNSPTTVAAGGVAFDPIGGGTTTVSASATGVRAAVPVTVTVSSPGMTLLSVPTLVGAGLMAGGGTARLGATGAWRRDGSHHQQQSGSAAGVAHPDHGGRGVRRCAGRQWQYRRELLGPRGRGGTGHGHPDGDGAWLYANAGDDDGRRDGAAVAERARVDDDAVPG